MEGLGWWGGKGSVWMIQDYSKLRTPPSGHNATHGEARLQESAVRGALWEL